MKTGDTSALTKEPGAITPGVGDKSTEHMEHDGDLDNSSTPTVCVFEEADPRVVDVVIYLTVDLVVSVLALVLGGTQLIIWLVF